LRLGAEQELDAARAFARHHGQDAALRLGVDRLIPRRDLAQAPAMRAHALDGEELAGAMAHVAARGARPAGQLVDADQLGLYVDRTAALLQPGEDRRRIARLDRLRRLEALAKPLEVRPLGHRYRRQALAWWSASRQRSTDSCHRGRRMPNARS